ncbi:MAG: GGDEF domain-containing protein [Rhodobacteraceae bacterium]|nr:GGDEF domain-containing protein [Paracoccaceae bacterium]MCZ8082810.1 GGDEF domain-containing protein [Paracoccaceae bacterium]
MAAGFELAAEALARLMPMHLALDGAGRILSAGYTLVRLVGATEPTAGGLVGAAFGDLFDLRHGGSVGSVAVLLEPGGGKVQLEVRGRPDLAFRGLAVPMGPGQGALVNLSFGIGVVEAVRRYALTEADFAPTDLTVELLYLYEAKTAVLEELRALNARLHGDKVVAEEQALTDALTGLRNRRGLDLAVEAVTDPEFALVHLDLDLFKQVNDALGHAAGDHVLLVVARILSEESRRGDTVARIGGDEFVLLMPGMDRVEPALGRIARIIARLSEPIAYGDAVCRIGASAGLILSAQVPGADVAQMLAHADAALYAAKRAGRGQVLLWRPDMAGE